MRHAAGGWVGAWLLALGLIGPAKADEGKPIGLIDLEAYRAALNAKPGGTAQLVDFHELWDRPEAHLGRAVAVSGRVARFFRQPKFGDFPPLIEAWVVSPSGDPFCLVYPQVEGVDGAGIGDAVRFSGTFLRQIRYRGGDVPRLAPLIVGPLAPDAPGPTSVRWTWATADGMMAAAATLVVALFLARRHLAGTRPVLSDEGPPPIFLDGRHDDASRGTDGRID